MILFCICKKRCKAGSGTFFGIPKDEERRKKWSEICRMHLKEHHKICDDHFSPSQIINIGNKPRLLKVAVPIVWPYQENGIDVTERTGYAAAPENSQNIVFENQSVEFTKTFTSSDIIKVPPEVQEKPIMEIPAAKLFSCASATQTNTRLCGLVETLELSHEFHLNCFYCSEVFPLEKWKNFADHLRQNHFEIEEEFKTCKYVSEDQKYASVDLTPSTPAVIALETVAIDFKSQLPLTTDPLDSASVSSCLKWMKVKEEELAVTKECESDSIEIVQQVPTEISFEYTPRDVVDLLLDSMTNYPVLWQFDDEPFNANFHEAVDNLCKIINDNSSLNITNLKMRRSINRILRYYCYLYPNDNVENIDQFTYYYDKCATFLPTSVSEIAYARCSHCYKCYRCDFDLKPHLLKEYKKLKWPYKCIKCKECFNECDEYEFHKCLPHYDEIFRCEQCNKTFHRRNVYNKHVADKHPKEAKCQCDVCEKVFKNRTYLRNHKIIHGEKKHKCNQCPKSFFEKGKLNLHLKLHRRQYDFMCEFCGQKLLTPTSLKVHMKKHTKEKITCNICNLKLRKSSLKQHLELRHVAYEGTIEQTLKGRHVNYRRFFKSSPFLQRRKYSEKKYECKICKISLNYELVMEHNKELHPDIPRWSCKMCVNDFSLKGALELHYRRKHKLERIQVKQLIEENEDLNVVLAYDKELSNKVTKKRNSKRKHNARESNIQIPIKFDEEKNYSSKILREIMEEPLTDDYFVEEKHDSPKVQDEIIKDSLTDNYIVGEKHDSSKIQNEIVKSDDNSIVAEDIFLIEFLEES